MSNPEKSAPVTQQSPTELGVLAARVSGDVNLLAESVRIRITEMRASGCKRGDIRIEQERLKSIQIAQRWLCDASIGL